MTTTLQPSIRTTDQSAQGRKLLFISGIVLIILGSFCVFTILLMLVGINALQTQRPPRPAPTSALLQPISLLIALAAILIWTGIASIRMRRWTRPVIIALTSVMLFGAAVIVLQILINLAAESFIANPAKLPTPHRQTQTLQPAPGLSESAAIAIGVFIGVAIPLAYLLIYRSRAIELALDEADPDIAWTDRLPLSVFILAAGLACFSYLAFLGFMPSPVRYVMGKEAPALEGLFQIVLSALLAMAALMVYRQHPGSPWTAIAIVASIAASTMLASSVVVANDPPNLHWQRWSVQERVAAAQAGALHTMLAALAFALPAIAYILYARRKMNTT